MWEIIVPHDAIVTVSWLGLRPRVEIKAQKWGAIYKPRWSGKVTMGPSTSKGRLLRFERA